MITDLARQRYALTAMKGMGAFSYRSLQTGMAALSGISSGWGMRLEDFDNDGWKDLFAAQGHVMDNVEQIDPVPALPGAALAGYEPIGPVRARGVAGFRAGGGKRRGFRRSE